jgi:hypothetical protein
VEVLVFVGVIVPVILTGAAGLLTAIKTSEQAQERQQLETALSSYGESLRMLPYRPCAEPVDYNTDHDAWPGRWVPPFGQVAPNGLLVMGVEYWDQASRTFRPTCSTDGGAQRLILNVRPSDDPTAVVTGVVVKRDPAGAPEGTMIDPVRPLTIEGAS